MPLIPGNLLSLNAQSIETSAAGWSTLTNSTIAQSATQAYDDTHSLSITATASGATDVIAATFPSVTPGTTYQFFFAAYTTSSGIVAQADGDFYNGSTFVSSFSAPNVSLTPNAWTWVSVTGVAPATSTLLRPIPFFTATAGGQVVFIDSVYFGPPTAFPWAAVGTNPALSLHNLGSASLTTQKVGDLIVMVNTDHSTTDFPSNVTSSRVTWTKAVPDQGPNSNSNISQSPTQWNGNVWFGLVNSVGSDTVTFSYTSGSTPSFTNAAAMEFTSPTGQWSLDTFAILNSSSGTATWPSVTPANSGGLFFGFAWNFGSSVAGSTTGYVYNANADTAGNGSAYNLTCAGGTATSPVWGDSTETYGIVVIVSQLPPAPPYSGTDGKLSSPAQSGLAQPGAFIPAQVEPSITTRNASLTAAATAHASFGGTKTAFRSFTAAATAHQTAGGTRTTFGSLTTAVTAHMAATGTRATFGSLTTAVTAHMTAARTRTTFGSLTTAAAAHMTAAGTKTAFGQLTAAATAHAAFTGTKTALGSLTSAATAHAAFTGTRTQFGTLNTAIAAHSSFAGTKTALGHLTTSATAAAAFPGSHTGSGNGALTTAVTAHAAFTPLTTHLGTFTAAVTAHSIFTGTRTQFGSLTANATAHATFSSLTTHLGSLTTSATAHVAFTGTRTRFGTLTTAATAHMTAAGTKTTFGSLTSSATAHAAFVRTRTTFGSLTTNITAHAAFSGTKTALRQFTSAATARALFSGTKNAAGHLTAAVVTHFLATGFKITPHQPQNLGGTVIQAVLDSGSDTLVPNPYGGTVTGANMGGGNIVLTLGGAANTVANVLGGSISDPGLGGTLTSIPFGGGVTGWTMQNVNLNFAEFNDITLNVTITSNGSALNLTGYTVNMLLKPLAGVLDSDGRVLTLSSAGGSPAITITNAATGACTVAIPHADLQDETHTFYRIDAVDGSGNINTAIYGNITYTSL